MKRYISLVLVAVMLCSFLLIGSPTTQAATKADVSRAIAIVFDNSGSMYLYNRMWWCQATYAMEVFASMLNKGDTLLIYPMHPIQVGDKEYTMDNPLKITDSSQSDVIREIYTPGAAGTPIETIDRAVEGLKTVQADKKYMIVLTDGDQFYRNGSAMSKDESRRQLDQRFQTANKSMTMMYLGIGPAIIPNTPESEYFVKRTSENSEAVLSMLTDMCNLIFGRDTLPDDRVNRTEKTVKFEISMKKLIVFVQGENISNLKVVDASGREISTNKSSTSTKYSTKGSNRGGTYDTSLQGMMVTYSDCAAGDYTIQYNGTATSVEFYYEPDAELEFVFTDSNGNQVDPNALYEGEYIVSYGMKDARTGQLIESDLLGKPHYEGSYTLNGKEVKFSGDGYSGSVPINLKMGDTFEARLMVTYLSGYVINKDSSDFGWPSGGIQVAARPAGELKLEITGGEEKFSLQELENSAPYIIKVYYKGELLTGEALKSVDLTWDPSDSHAQITKEVKDDHIELKLHYADPANPQNTTAGQCTVPLRATYTEEGSAMAQTIMNLSYNIDNDYSSLQLEMEIEEDYIVISEIDESPAIVVKLRINGAPLTAEEFAAVKVTVNCSGINHTVTPCPEESSYIIQLQSTDGIGEGDYDIVVSAEYTDLIGRTNQDEASALITLSVMALWLKWLIGILLLLLIIIIIWLILHIKKLPKGIVINRRDSTVIYNGEDVTSNTSFTASALSKNSIKIMCSYDGETFGFVTDAKPGKESYLMTPSKKRRISITPASVKPVGSAKPTEVNIGGLCYEVNKETNAFEPTPTRKNPFEIKHGAAVSYSGTINEAGKMRPYSVETKIFFKK